MFSCSPSKSPVIGSHWQTTSLIAGHVAGQGETANLYSPANGELVQQIQLLDSHEIETLGHLESEPLHIEFQDLTAFCERLYTQLHDRASLLQQALQLETGFIGTDCEELVSGSLQFVREFPHMVAQWQPESYALVYDSGAGNRTMQIERSAWGTVAIVLPQNAFLLVALTCLLNALAAGNRVILRAPLQSARSAALLAQAIQEANEPWQAISLVNARAQELLKVLYASPASILIHYMGGSNRAAALWSDCFNNGKPAIIDGSGNTWVWIDENVPLDEAAHLLTTGAIRYNGQTCTSINGAMIHPRLYPQLRDKLQQQWRNLTYGNPVTEDVQVGPLFDEKQALWCQQQLSQSGGTLLVGGEHKENLLLPTLIENPAPSSTLVCEGLFGPALWITSGTAQDFCALWNQNHYPLCAAIISPQTEASWWAPRLKNLSRLILNGDPSQEYIHEPWGGYPSSSANTVGRWLEKYQRVLQVDVASR
jgi:acyl-CoA reductase-like NAD-dependent aldehyde dehydrogenase